jgi:hypothetical protein
MHEPNTEIYLASNNRGKHVSYLRSYPALPRVILARDATSECHEGIQTTNVGDEKLLLWIARPISFIETLATHDAYQEI